MNRARNIDSQFGSEQRKAGSSVFFSSSKKEKKFCLSYFSPSILCPFLILSFFPVHRFERHSAVTWLFSLAHGKGSLHSLSSSTILYNLFCYFVFRFSLFFSIERVPVIYAFDRMRDIRFSHHTYIIYIHKIFEKIT